MKNFDKQVQELKEIALKNNLEVKLRLEVKDFTLTTTYSIVDTETGDVYEFGVYDNKYLFRGNDDIRRYAEIFILKDLYFDMLSYEDKLKSLQLVSTYFNLEDFDKYEENIFENKLNKRQVSTETFDELVYDIKFERKQRKYIFDISINIKKQKDKMYLLKFEADIYKKVIQKVRDESVEDEYLFTLTERVEFENFPETINFFNNLYEQASLEFNKILSEEIKKITKEEEQKQQEKQSGQGDGDGESQEGGQESLEDMINDIINSKPSGTSGQSTTPKDSVDLEDFINEVQKGNIDNKDFTEQYKNKDLAEKIQAEKQGSLSDSGMSSDDTNDDTNDDTMRSSSSQDFEMKNEVLNGMAKFLSSSVNDLKRRFPTEKSIKSFFLSLQKNEISELAEFSNLSKELTIPEAKKILQETFINELKNI